MGGTITTDENGTTAKPKVGGIKVDVFSHGAAGVLGGVSVNPAEGELSVRAGVGTSVGNVYVEGGIDINPSPGYDDVDPDENTAAQRAYQHEKDLNNQVIAADQQRKIDDPTYTGGDSFRVPSGELSRLAPGTDRGAISDGRRTPMGDPIIDTVQTPAGPRQVWVGSHYAPASPAANSGGISSAEGAANNGHEGTRGSGGSLGAGAGPGRSPSDPADGGSNSSNSGTGPQNGGKSTPKGPGEISDGKQIGAQPILLDLNGNGIQIADLSKSTQFIDAGGDGLKHRSAWVAAGDGVLFLDADGDGKISDRREYVFTDWAPGASDDMEALRAAFDSNGDGKLTAADARFSEFKVMVTGADGAASVRRLVRVGIGGIELRAEVRRVVVQARAA